MKTQTKTALFILCTFLLLIVLFSGFLFVSISRYSNEVFFKLLEVKALTIAKSNLRSDSKTERSLLIEIRKEAFDDLPNKKEFILPLSDSVNWMEYANQTELPIEFLKEIQDEGFGKLSKKEIAYYGIIYSTDNEQYIVIASAENIIAIQQNEYLRRIFVTAIAVAFVISFFVAIYFSKYIFKPIKSITQKVRQISSENLHLRLESNNKNDELRELTITFNDMLDRIETSFETQNNFISNASHELRTPLTAIIGEADVAMSKIRTAEEYIESLKIIIDEAEKLDSKTKALLFLAQTGFNGKVQKFDKVRIDQLLWDVKETIKKINPLSKVSIDMGLLPENPTKLKVKGNDQLLHLAFTNIINNACKYSDNKPVMVSIGCSDDKVIVVVKDNGIGIPENELKYIYDPFFRGSNTKNYEGYGIGLPLTLNIIRMHSGEMMVSSIQNEGTTVQINLPVGHYSIG